MRFVPATSARAAVARRPAWAVLVVALALLCAALLGGCAGSGTATSTSTSTTRSVSALAPATATTDLPTVPVGDLPPQAVDTLRLIAAGGPFPYSKDGATFQNREGLLPEQSSGFYREYTVVTPGSTDRGARRIIGGEDGSRFYTDDHYASFHEVVSGVGS